MATSALTADAPTELPDETGFAGTAVAYVTPDGAELPGIVRGTYRPAPDRYPNTTRALVECDDRDGLIDTDSAHLEVL